MEKKELIDILVASAFVLGIAIIGLVYIYNFL
jgi:hypothetical protein